MSIDNRKDQRLDRQENLYIELLSASEEDSKDNVLIECTTKDISSTGLQIVSDNPFILNSILELLINFESGGYKFLLTAEVKWLQRIEGNGYIAGFQLIDAEHSDFVVWQKMFEN